MKRLSPKTDLTTWTDEELRSRLDVEVAKYNRNRGKASDVSFGKLLEAEMACHQLGAEIRRRRSVVGH